MKQETSIHPTGLARDNAKMRSAEAWKEIWDNRGNPENQFYCQKSTAYVRAIQQDALASLASPAPATRSALKKCVAAIKRIADNVGEFGTVTDSEFFDALWDAEKIGREALSISSPAVSQDRADGEADKKLVAAWLDEDWRELYDIEFPSKTAKIEKVLEAFGRICSRQPPAVDKPAQASGTYRIDWDIERVIDEIRGLFGIFKAGGKEWADLAIGGREELREILGRRQKDTAAQSADAVRDAALEEATERIKERLPKNIKVSENTAIYRAQDHAVAICLQEIRALKSKPAASTEESYHITGFDVLESVSHWGLQ